MDMTMGNLWMVASFAGVVIAVLAVVLVLLRVRGGFSARRNGRLGIQDYCAVDKSRRLVIVRRDNVEHLLLIGGPQDLVVETGIQGEPEVAHRPQTRSFREELEEVGRPPALAPVPLRPAPTPVASPTPLTMPSSLSHQSAPLASPALRSVTRMEPRMAEKNNGKGNDAGDNEIKPPQR